jgi:hypothetical protein
MKEVLRTLGTTSTLNTIVSNFGNEYNRGRFGGGIFPNSPLLLLDALQGKSCNIIPLFISPHPRTNSRRFEMRLFDLHPGCHTGLGISVPELSPNY